MVEPAAFPVDWITDETPPRRITLLGTSALNPDVWVARIDGEDRVAWVVKCGGGICHPTTNVHKVHARPDEPRVSSLPDPWAHPDQNCGA